MTTRRFLAVAIAPFLLLAAPAWPQKQAEPPPSPSPEAPLVAVARHLSDAYALYLYESLTAQVLFNEGLLERPNSPLAPKTKDSLWALQIISHSILAEGEDGQYLNAKEVPVFFEDIVHRYMNASPYWPDLEITKETRREHLAAWYALYLMLLVANATQDEIARKLRTGAFHLVTGILETEVSSLVDRLKMVGTLTTAA